MSGRILRVCETAGSYTFEPVDRAISVTVEGGMYVATSIFEGAFDFEKMLVDAVCTSLAQKGLQNIQSVSQRKSIRDSANRS